MPPIIQGVIRAVAEYQTGSPNRLAPQRKSRTVVSEFMGLWACRGDHIVDLLVTLSMHNEAGALCGIMCHHVCTRQIINNPA
jgi:hypothetical protein